jgi:hypothetical protein
MNDHPTPTLFSPNREELAWAAGFVDGEGSFTGQMTGTRMTENGPKTYRWNYPRFEIGQSGSPFLLERFRLAVGYGKVYGPYPPGSHRRMERFMYSAHGYVQVKRIADLLWEWLGPVKRNQAQGILDGYTQLTAARRTEIARMGAAAQWASMSPAQRIDKMRKMQRIQHIRKAP